MNAVLIIIQKAMRTNPAISDWAEYWKSVPTGHAVNHVLRAGGFRPIRF